MLKCKAYMYLTCTTALVMGSVPEWLVDYTGLCKAGYFMECPIIQLMAFVFAVVCGWIMVINITLIGSFGPQTCKTLNCFWVKSSS